MPFSEWNQQTLEDLKRAIQQALEQGELVRNDRMQRDAGASAAMTPEQMDKLLENLVQKLVDEGHITIEEPGDPSSAGAAGARQRSR